MATSNFINMRDRTKKLYGHLRDLTENKTTKLLSDAIQTQVDIKKQFDSVKNDYKKNKELYSLLYNEVLLLKRKKEKPKFDKIKNIFDRNRSGNKGILSSILSGLGTAGMIMRPLLSKLTKDISRMTKGLTGTLSKLLKSMGGAGKNIIKGAARGGLSRAASAAALNIGAGTGRVAVANVARFIGAGVVGAAASAVGYPLLIASAAAAVGYGTYKLGRYLKLSEKLDDFIKKVSGGKYRDIGDFILGLVDGSIGKELYSWVKDKISSLFTDATLYLKDKTNDVLGKWSPFINDPTTQAGGAEDNVNAVEEGPNSGNPNSEKTDPSTNANDEFRKTLSGGVAGIQTDMMSAAKDYTDNTPVMMQGVDGYNGSNVSSGAVGGNLAYAALTNGANTVITSRFGKRKGNSTVSANHTGIDIAASVGTPIYAPEAGRVTKSIHPRGGIQAHLHAKSGIVYGLAHLSSVNAIGEVKAGEMIAKSGNTGSSTGPHIHLSVTRNGQKVNPEGFRIPSKKNKTKLSDTKIAKPGIGGPGADDGVKNAEFGISYDSPASASLNHSHKVASNKSIEYANGFTTNSSKSVSSESSNTMSSSPGITSAKRSSLQAQTSSKTAASASSRAGSIEGKTPSIKDPRGALNSDIMLASTSPLFV